MEPCLAGAFAKAYGATGCEAAVTTESDDVGRPAAARARQAKEKSDAIPGSGDCP
jgi:hypothetical protein